VLREAADTTELAATPHHVDIVSDPMAKGHGLIAARECEMMKQHKEQRSTSFHELPDDVLHAIMHLMGRRDLVRCANCCHLWRTTTRQVMCSPAWQLARLSVRRMLQWVAPIDDVILLSRLRAYPHELWRRSLCTGRLALHVACLTRGYGILPALLTAFPNAASVGDFQRMRPLHYAAMTNAPSEIICLIIDASPASCSARDVHGWLPLHHAASTMSTDALSMLLRAHSGASSVRDPLGRTPLHLLAASRFHRQPLWLQAEESPSRCALLSTMELLSNAPWAKYTMDTLGQTPLMEALYARAPDQVLRMLGHRPKSRWHADRLQPQLQHDGYIYIIKSAAIGLQCFFAWRIIQGCWYAFLLHHDVIRRREHFDAIIQVVESANLAPLVRASWALLVLLITGIGWLSSRLAGRPLSLPIAIASRALFIFMAHPVTSVVTGEPAHAYTLSAYPRAKCLDGSPARYYLSQSAERPSSRVFVFFEGGGFCQSLSDCQARAMTRLGSTLQDPPTMTLDRLYFTRSLAASPLLGSFTFAFVRYCDGGYFSGERTLPVTHNGTRLHFNGLWIVHAVFNALRLGQANEVVIGGCSAGGIHVLAHLDSLRSMLPSSVSVVGFADSGFYIDVPFFTKLKRFVVSPNGQNATQLLNRACVAAFPGAMEKCLIAQRAVPFVQTPTFVWQSRYDMDQRSCELTAACAASRACIDAYASNLSRAIHAAIGAHHPHYHAWHGAFIDTCRRHCDENVTLPLAVAVDGVTPLQAFGIWYHKHRQNSTALVWEVAGSATTC